LEPPANPPASGAGQVDRRLFVAVTFESRPVAIYLSGVAVDVGVAPVETSFLLVLTGRPSPRRPIMPTGLVVVIVGCLVMLYIEALFLVGGHCFLSLIEMPPA
jgi:hypothetical protein